MITQILENQISRFASLRCNIFNGEKRYLTIGIETAQISEGKEENSRGDFGKKYYAN